MNNRTRVWIGAAAGATAVLLNAQTFREQVNVELVRVEILATDANGRPVRGLRASQLRVKVDGRTVSIDSFESPPLPDLPTAQPLPAAPAAAAVPTLPAIPIAGPPVTATAPRPFYMAFLLDETSSEQSNRKVVLAELFRFLESGVPPEVRVLLMRFNGTLRVECPWTTDISEIHRGLAALTRHRAAALLGAPGQISGNPERGSANLQLDAMEAVGHARTSLTAFFDALRVFPEKPGRKALFVVTDGAPFLTPAEIARDLIAGSSSSVSAGDPDAARRAALEADRDSDLLLDGLAWDRARSVSLLTDIARLALLRGIEVHPVMAAPHDLGGRVSTDRGFHARASVDAGRPISGRSIRGAEASPTTDIAAGQGMETMAETTGGEAVLSRRFVKDGLRSEMDARDGAYVVSFRDPFAGDHRFHRIEISIAGGGAKLRYRRGYRVLDVRESLIESAVNRLQVPGDENPLGVRLQFDSLGVDHGNAQAEITVAYPAPPQAGGKTGASGAVQVIAVCAVRDGPLSQPIDLSGKTEAVSFGDATWLVLSGKVRVKPGAYRWSFAIRDEQTGIESYLSFERRVP
jgi:VWFA-related protein